MNWVSCKRVKGSSKVFVPSNFKEPSRHGTDVIAGEGGSVLVKSECPLYIQVERESRQLSIQVWRPLMDD